MALAIDQNVGRKIFYFRISKDEKITVRLQGNKSTDIDAKTVKVKSSVF